jgi:transposase
MKYFAGLDVSLDETAICVVDEDGIVVTEGKAASEPDDLVRWLVATGLTITRVGLEAGPLSPWLHTELRAAGLPAICIETRRMKGATAAMAVKTDRNDARAIAHAMLSDLDVAQDRFETVRLRIRRAVPVKARWRENKDRLCRAFGGRPIG